MEEHHPTHHPVPSPKYEGKCHVVLSIPQLITLTLRHLWRTAGCSALAARTKHSHGLSLNMLLGARGPQARCKLNQNQNCATPPKRGPHQEPPQATPWTSLATKTPLASGM